MRASHRESVLGGAVQRFIKLEAIELLCTVVPVIDQILVVNGNDGFGHLRQDIGLEPNAPHPACGR